MKQKRIFVFLLAVNIAVSFAIWAGSDTKVQAEERQSRMQAALHHLLEAQEELRAAEHDKGRRRATAMSVADQATAKLMPAFTTPTSTEKRTA